MATSIKEHWEELSEKHRDNLKADIEAFVDRSKDLALGAVVIGGGFALSYYLIKKMGGGKKVKVSKKKDYNDQTSEVTIEKQPSMLSNVGHVVLTEITVFLLAIAKEKLIQYLQNINTEEENNEYTEHS
ncbi:hypothetical protein LVD15_05270 [Fulvivirga maritima]|uniref:hypothetical protein n=1 Tax=Fulvivirga maritima TaxID=2904247 RepID=UPI001F38CD63|nr:hypothetical protein [Fulvivirga maritima]UII27835.1 hypothetical protein LVD15_05270 [Fulvivirga maritima]